MSDTHGSPSELNPNHPVTTQVRDQWHKLLAFAMFKNGTRTLTITLADMNRFEEVLPGGCIVFQPKGDAITIRLVSAEEGERLARQQGGLPA